jgi:uncharacterized protein with HEPN domain
LSTNRDIRDYIDDIRIFIASMTYEEFIADRKTINAVIRSLEIIGEAAKKIPKDFRQRYPKVP